MLNTDILAFGRVNENHTSVRENLIFTSIIPDMKTELPLYKQPREDGVFIVTSKKAQSHRPTLTVWLVFI